MPEDNIKLQQALSKEPPKGILISISDIELISISDIDELGKLFELLKKFE